MASFGFQVDKQPLRWLALSIALSGLTTLALAAFTPARGAAYFNLCGVLLNLVGCLFIVSGVALDREQVSGLRANYKPKKWLRKVSGLAIAASNVVAIGSAYLIVGSLMQVASSVWR